MQPSNEKQPVSKKWLANRSHSLEEDKFSRRHIREFLLLYDCTSRELRKGTDEEDWHEAKDYVAPIDTPKTFRCDLDGRVAQADCVYFQIKVISGSRHNTLGLAADYQKQYEKKVNGQDVPVGDIIPDWGVVPSKTPPHFIGFGFPDYRPIKSSLDRNPSWPLYDLFLWIEYNLCIETIKSNLERWRERCYGRPLRGTYDQYYDHTGMGQRGRERTWCIFFPAFELWHLCRWHPQTVFTWGGGNTDHLPSWVRNAISDQEYDRKKELLWSSRMRTLPRCDFCAKRFEPAENYLRKNEQGQWTCTQPEQCEYLGNPHDQILS